MLPKADTPLAETLLSSNLHIYLLQAYSKIPGIVLPPRASYN